MIFPLYFKFDVNFIMLSSKLLWNGCYEILQMAWYLCYCGMCKSLYLYDTLHWSYTKTEFLLNLNYDGKIVCNKRPGNITHLMAKNNISICWSTNWCFSYKLCSSHFLWQICTVTPLSGLYIWITKLHLYQYTVLQLLCLSVLSKWMSTLAQHRFLLMYLTLLPDGYQHSLRVLIISSMIAPGKPSNKKWHLTSIRITQSNDCVILMTGIPRPRNFSVCWIGALASCTAQSLKLKIFTW